ncbi:acyltransferase family protein [Fusibacter sp. JL216-2]|uniref:acyltransferase family protein n=1 Tax=Fusibacter sp. JL216-2 TaxID=3071453 RepID=UPI003D32AE55
MENENRYYHSIGNLRAVVIVMVVLHHALLAYTTLFSFEDSYLIANVIPLSNLFNPVLNSTKTKLFDLIIGLNDVYFMSLLFFISGLFFWNTIQSKGARNYLISRVKKLGVPFVLGVLLLVPLAYYPAVLQRAHIRDIQVLDYGKYWIQLANFKFLSGPFWFVGMLLLFTILSTVIYFFKPSLQVSLRDRHKKVFENEWVFTSLLILASAVAYIPMLSKYSPYEWIGIGALSFQAVRIFHYGIYFLAGLLTGAYGINKSFLMKNHEKSWRWLIWIVFGVIVFFTVSFENPFHFILSCASFSLGLLNLFCRFFNQQNALMTLLNKNGYGIYILHYPVSSWIQWAMVSWQMSPLFKGMITFAFSLAISCALTSLIMRSAKVRKILG